MSTFSRGARIPSRNVFDVAWMRCESSFCFCFTIRTGASMIGWFNFVFNSLYVGMLVFALARAEERLDRHISVLKSAMSSSFEGSGEITIPSWNEEYSDLLLPILKDCKTRSTDKNALSTCICEANTIKVGNSTERDCSYLTEASKQYPSSDCLSSLEYISYVIMPLMYKSIAIPGFMIVLSILWLIAVESSIIRFIRFIGFALIVCTPVQLVLQLYYQIYAGKRFHEGNLGTLHPVVWAVYVVYAILNIYFLAILYRYLKLRTKECAQGIEQGLLTSERHPPSNKDLDVYLEDAFSIEADINNDRFRYSIDDNDDDDESDDNIVVQYDLTKRNHATSPMSGTVDTTLNSHFLE